MAKDPTYPERLRLLPPLERRRLADACWSPLPGAGIMFKREWFRIVDAPSTKVIARARGWDLAATAPHAANKDPDHTRGVRLAFGANAECCWEDEVGCRLPPGGRNDLIRQTALADGPGVIQAFERAPGEAGLDQEAHMRGMLDMCGSQVGKVVFFPATGSKEVHAANWSSWADRDTSTRTPGFTMLRRPWNAATLDELVKFPTKGVHDDRVDAASRAWQALMQVRPVASLVGARAQGHVRYVESLLKHS